MKKILVIGARGKTGQHVVTELVLRGAAVLAASRTPEQFDIHGVGCVRFDWNDVSTWLPALENVDGVYLVKPQSGQVVEIVTRFLALMKTVGTIRLVMLSECAAQTRSDDITERQVEIAVEASGLEWTILRPNWYMEDIVDGVFFGAMIRNKRTIVMTTGGASIAWVDTRDVANVAAEVLYSGGLPSQALELTGPEALTLDQLAERISAVTGDRVQAIEESVTQAEARMRSDGFDDDFVAYITRISQSIIAGDTAMVTNDVERITGYPPRTIAAFLSENAALLQPSTR
ncbi:NAD(P)H-binding protein [Massilia orientalis]|uniref:NAD(P)H-binding protein n=1 Tax=Massilia orientalis TaxID=3050128 RepID=A0ACC7MMK4_9BURK|nr:NAD(P)H-binding protein [Massilia sp. YIM B02787]